MSTFFFFGWKPYSIGFVFLKNYAHTTFRSFSIEIWKFKILQKFSKKITTEILQKLKSIDLSFRCISVVKFLKNFRFSKFDRKRSKSRVSIIFEENKTDGIGLSAKQKIFDIGPKINFLKDPSTHPPYDA